MQKTKTEIKAEILACLKYKTKTETGTRYNIPAQTLARHFKKRLNTIYASRKPDTQNPDLYDKLYTLETAYAKIAELLEEL